MLLHDGGYAQVHSAYVELCLAKLLVALGRRLVEVEDLCPGQKAHGLGQPVEAKAS